MKKFQHHEYVIYRQVYGFKYLESIISSFMDRRNFGKEALLSMVSWFVLPPFFDGKARPQNMEICPEHHEMILEAKKELSFHLQGNSHLVDQYLEPVRYSCHGDTKTTFYILNQHGHEIELYKNQDAVVRFKITIPG